MTPDSLPVGMFLSLSRERRQEFQLACGEQFSRLFIASDIDSAESTLGRNPVARLIVDLAHFDRALDIEALGRLITLRRGEHVLAVVPFAQAGWIEALRAFGPVDYVIGPVSGDALAQAALRPQPGAASGASLRQLLAVRAQLEHAVSAGDNGRTIAQRVCDVLLAFPGAAHASLFELRPEGDLRIAAQAGEAGVALGPVLGRTEQLHDEPEHRAFPGILAALQGEPVLLDAPAKAGDGVLASRLAAHGIRMAAAFPLFAADGRVRGSLCLMFNRERTLSHDDFATFASLSALAGLAMRVAELERESARLASQMAHLEATDYLTGVPNRRSGEQLLEHEMRRALRYQAPLALLAFDIDRFSSLNERYGTACGDLALTTLADLARSHLRGSDVLVRSDGDLFHVIAPHTSIGECAVLAEKLRVAVGSADFPGCDRLTISLGVAQLQAQETADQLVLRTNAALARAKRAGRNCIELART